MSIEDITIPKDGGRSALELGCGSGYSCLLGRQGQCMIICLRTPNQLIKIWGC